MTLLAFMSLLTAHTAVAPSTMPGVPLPPSNLPTGRDDNCAQMNCWFIRTVRKKHQLMSQMYTKQMLKSFYGWMTPGFPDDPHNFTDDPHNFFHFYVCVCLVPTGALRIMKCQEPHLLFFNNAKAYLTLTLPRVLWVPLGKLLFLSGPMATPVSAQEQSFFLFPWQIQRQEKLFFHILFFLEVTRGQDRVTIGKVNHQQWVKTREREM